MKEISNLSITDKKRIIHNVYEAVQLFQVQEFGYRNIIDYCKVIIESVASKNWNDSYCFYLGDHVKAIGIYIFSTNL